MKWLVIKSQNYINIKIIFNSERDESKILINPKVLYEKYINKIENNINKLELLNPLNALKRGYGIVKKDKKTIEDIKNIKINETTNIDLKNGSIDAVVTNIKEEL